MGHPHSLPLAWAHYNTDHEEEMGQASPHPLAASGDGAGDILVHPQEIIKNCVKNYSRNLKKIDHPPCSAIQH